MKCRHANIKIFFLYNLFKVFHCTQLNNVAIDNDAVCWEGYHWAYIVPVAVAILALFVVFPIWLIWRIRHESLASADQHHEEFLKLKEVNLCFELFSFLFRGMGKPQCN